MPALLEESLSVHKYACCQLQPEKPEKEGDMKGEFFFDIEINSCGKVTLLLIMPLKPLIWSSPT
jgi:hypothetical protein